MYRREYWQEFDYAAACIGIQEVGDRHGLAHEPRNGELFECDLRAPADETDHEGFVATIQMDFIVGIT
jgi:hypothetical protein